MLQTREHSKLVLCIGQPSLWPKKKTLMMDKDAGISKRAKRTRADFDGFEKGGVMKRDTYLTIVGTGDRSAHRRQHFNT